MFFYEPSGVDMNASPCTRFCLRCCLLFPIFVFSISSDAPDDSICAKPQSKWAGSHQINPKRYEVIGSKGDRPGYAKIQEAIEAARREGASSKHPAIVIVEPGRYEENLILYDGIEIQGVDGEKLVIDQMEEGDASVKIAGTYTLPEEGSVILKNLTFQTTRPEFGSDLSSAAENNSSKKKNEKNPKAFIIPASERTDPAFANASCEELPSFAINGAVFSNTTPTGPLQAATLSPGELLIGGTGAPAAASLTAGAGIAITQGDHSITITAATSPTTLTFDGDTGSAIPAANVITLKGGSTGLTTTASGSEVDLTGTLAVTNGGTSAKLFPINGAVFSNTTTTGALQAATLGIGELLIGGTGAPAPNPLTAGDGITITAGNNSIMIASTPTQLTIDADTGSATSVGNVITLKGGSTGLTTTGSGSEVDLTGTLAVTNGGTSAKLFPINGAVFSNTTATGTLQAATLTSGQLLIGGTGAPAAASLQAGSGILITPGNNSITIAGISSINTITLTTTGANTYTPSANAIFVYVQIVAGGGGGGGGGAGGLSNGGGGSGGGAGSYAAGFFMRSSLLPSVTVTIGAGGTAGGTTAPFTGGTGGNTTFGALLTTNGGHGGTGVANGAGFLAGGVGGAAGTGAPIASPGQNGGVAFVSVNIGTLSGGGAPGPFSPGAAPTISTGTGVAATRFGGGGSGAAVLPDGAALVGGAGTGGVAYIIEFLN